MWGWVVELSEIACHQGDYAWGGKLDIIMQSTSSIDYNC